MVLESGEFMNDEMMKAAQFDGPHSPNPDSATN